MKPIIIASIVCLLYLLELTLIFRAFTINNKAKFMLYLWVINLPILLALHFYIPADLHFLRGDFVIQNQFMTSILSLFLYTVGFFGGILQLYNLADRGFSLRILIDLYKSHAKGMSLDDVMIGYSDGRGIKWMYQKRTDQMQTIKVIQFVDGKAINTAKGSFIANVFIGLRGFFKLDYNRTI